MAPAPVSAYLEPEHCRRVGGPNWILVAGLRLYVLGTLGTAVGGKGSSCTRCQAGVQSVLFTSAYPRGSFFSSVAMVLPLWQLHWPHHLLLPMRPNTRVPVQIGGGTHCFPVLSGAPYAHFGVSVT